MGGEGKSDEDLEGSGIGREAETGNGVEQDRRRGRNSPRITDESVEVAPSDVPSSSDKRRSYPVQWTPIFWEPPGEIKRDGEICENLWQNKYYSCC